MFNRKPKLQVKTATQFGYMRQAGLVVAAALEATAATVEPGRTTADLNAIAAKIIADAGAEPSFLGYHGYPAHICVSVNEEIVHGIPGPRVLQDGDLVSIDCGAIINGWHGDAAVTVACGNTSEEALKLSEVTRQSMWRGLAKAVAGNKLTDIGAAIEDFVLSQGDYGVVEDYVGHGIGTAMHMDPSVPNYGPAGNGPKLVAGLALAIEPMMTLGAQDSEVLADDWTVRTLDGKWAAHWEHTVAITENGPWVMTAKDGGAAEFAALGVPSPAASLA
jgi:methionyl aminopeptidase